jgi:hypothetical protein
MSERKQVGRRRFVAGTAGVLGALAAAPVAARTQATGAVHPIVGSWLTNVEFDGDNTSLTSLMTFFADGAVMVANAGQFPGLPPASGVFFTGGHGAWEATGDQTVDATFVFLTLNNTGSLASIDTSRTSVEVDETGSGFTGTAVIDLTGPGGDVPGAARSTFTGSRIRVSPMDAAAATPAA